MKELDIAHKIVQKSLKRSHKCSTTPETEKLTEDDRLALDLFKKWMMKCKNPSYLDIKKALQECYETYHAKKCKICKEAYRTKKEEI